MTVSSERMTVAVVLVNWSSGVYTSDCLRSLNSGTIVPDRIMVFDNGSTDGSPAMIAREFPEAELIMHDRNIGFAAACNVCIRKAMESDINVVWLLNNDTVVDHDCLAKLLEELSKPNVDVVTSKILFFDDADRLWYAGGGWKRWCLEARQIGYGEKDFGQYDQPLEVTFVSGCCLMARVSVFERVGLLNEKYFAYSEDAEWCLRAMSAGMHMRYLPQARILHKESASVRKNTMAGEKGRYSSFVVEISVRNRFFLIRQHAHRPWQFLIAFGKIMMDCTRTGCILIVLGRIQKLKALVKGMWEGLTQNPGR